ncbi:MAG: battenin CLN3 protein [Vezdaea aestivalis]|nr:MAG: battenin CLN3 protein [Vezdaea aestivalis]
MLPPPGAPGATWARYKAGLASLFEGADLRVCAAFWLFGLINNVLYVIILSAALDLVGPLIPKGVVLLADVLPSFISKLVLPYLIQSIPYAYRVLFMAAVSALGMSLIAVTAKSSPTGEIPTKLTGVVLASFSSGVGEMSFLSMTHFYGPFSLAAWGSGTGAAGLIGAGAYVLATTVLGLSVSATLTASACLPAVMLAAFFLVLPKGPLASKGNLKNGEYQGLPTVEEDDEDQSLLATEESPTSSRGSMSISGLRKPASAIGSAWTGFKANLQRSRHLVIPYMLPLLLVYVAEYTINQGVAPTLLFPLSQSPFKEYRAFYPTYNALYQAGVFTSRSSTPFFRLHHLYIPSFLQCANLVLLTLHALLNFLPSVYLIFAIVFWEGILGGLVYVNTFAEISENVPEADREFSLGATSVSDSGGICIAGFIGMGMEVWLCKWQVAHGRDYCHKI